MPTDSQTLCRTAEAYLHAQIPFTRTMGAGIESYDATTGRLILTAPLEPNHNHLGTAFGGSLSALSTLAGYALLWLELERQNSGGAEASPHTKAHVVVKESTISYRHPVKENMIRVVCERPAAALMQAFHQQFANKGKARIQLASTVTENGKVCVEFTGMYVAVG